MWIKSLIQASSGLREALKVFKKYWALVLF